MKNTLLFCFAVLSTLPLSAQKDSLKKIDANRLLIVVENKVGYIDTLGRKKIDPAFSLGSQFSEGVASVTQQTGKGLRYAFIDDDLNVVIPIMFDAAGDFSEGLARVQVNGKWGYINKKGNTVIEPEYNLCYEFINGYAQASKKNKWGLIDKKGEWIIAPFYQDITRVNEGALAVQEKLGGAWKFIDVKGKPILNDSFSRAGYFNKGLAPVRNSEDKWGYINKKGEVIIPFQFSGAMEFSDNGLASVGLNGYWGFINTKGEIVIEYQYSRGAKFRYNYALVEKGDTYGYINTKGDFIWKYEE